MKTYIGTNSALIYTSVNLSNLINVNVDRFFNTFTNLGPTNLIEINRVTLDLYQCKSKKNLSERECDTLGTVSTSEIAAQY